MAYQKNGLTITFTCAKDPSNPANMRLTANFANANPAPLTKFQFQAAVPKDMQHKMEPATGDTIPAGNAAPVSQVVKVLNPQQKPLRLMMKIQYETNGQQVAEKAVAESFPPGF